MNVMAGIALGNTRPTPSLGGFLLLILGYANMLQYAVQIDEIMQILLSTTIKSHRWQFNAESSLGFVRGSGVV